MAMPMLFRSRVMERRGTPVHEHLSAIDQDLDSQERANASAFQVIQDALDDIKNSQRWLLRTCGAGVVSLAVLVLGYVVTGHGHP